MNNSNNTKFKIIRKFKTEKDAIEYLESTGPFFVDTFDGKPYGDVIDMANLSYSAEMYIIENGFLDKKRNKKDYKKGNGF